MHKLQNMLAEYTFPYWNEEDRVIGQPTNHLNLKYQTTYKRVADLMIQMGSDSFKNLNLMGLFATNHRTIGNYLQFHFKNNTSIVPTIDQVAVVERNKDVCLKILYREHDGNKYEGNLVLLNTQLRHLLFSPGAIGAPPLNHERIVKYRSANTRAVNFIDLDLMCNWGNSKEMDLIPALISQFAAPTSVVHINAISNFSRTLDMKRSRIEIENILQQQIFKKINRNVTNYSIESYVTKTRVETEMTSAVIAIHP